MLIRVTLAARWRIATVAAIGGFAIAAALAQQFPCVTHAEVPMGARLVPVKAASPRFTTVTFVRTHDGQPSGPAERLGTAGPLLVVY